jgi:hypothetical protein
MDTTVPAVEARRWETLAPLTGIAAVVLFIAGFIVHDVIGDTPGADAPAADFSRYYQQEDGSIWGGSTLIAFAIVFFFWFIGSLRAALHSAEGGVGRLAATAHAGGIATAVLIMASIGTQVSAAILVSDRDTPLAPDTAVAFWWLGDGVFLAAFYSTAVLIAATAVVALRTGVIPRWFAWISLVAALVLVVPFIGWAAFIFALPIWIAVTSYLLWRNATRSPAM